MATGNASITFLKATRLLFSVCSLLPPRTMWKVVEMSLIVAQAIVSQHFSHTGPCQHVEPVTSGFSGACVYRVQSAAGLYALRRWPPDADAARIVELHELLLRVAQQGLPVVPVPLADCHQNTLIRDGGSLWQIEPWMPGSADFWQRPSETRLVTACETLARWHIAARLAARPDSRWFRTMRDQSSASVASRLQTMRGYSTDVLQRIETAVVRERNSDWADLGRCISTAFRLHAGPVADELRPAADWRVELQPVIRDVWHDHVLFTGDDVTGLIDYGAALSDTVATDLSRLLGSFLGDDSVAWERALNAYDRVRQLSMNERRLVAILDRSNVLLSGMTWLRRRYVDLQPLTNEARVLERLRRIASRLDRWSQLLPSQGFLLP